MKFVLQPWQILLLILAGCTPNPDDSWVVQVGRNLTDSEEGVLRDERYLLMDRDTKYHEAFRSILKQSGIEPVRLPPHSPNLNAHIERFMRSLKEECLERLILFGEGSLRNAVSEFLIHYNSERNHQGLHNRLIQPGCEAGKTHGEIACRHRLGGMLQYYYREAA
jgi:hypothetical protein